MCHSQGADICRLWRIHQALYCFDYDLEESGEIKDMLLECFISINYIKKEEVNRHLFFDLFVSCFLIDVSPVFTWFLSVPCVVLP